MGQAIRELGWKRSDIVVSTKIFWGGQGPNDKGLSRKHIVKGTKASLKRLDMDYVDVIYCHRPDTSTPIEETENSKGFDRGITIWCRIIHNISPFYVAACIVVPLLSDIMGAFCI
ncbi:hypothetical protein CUMW_271160 [Citrus unshiu]|uniref:NADP-dependent oxidoreductase domain-containing protein n=1 Tax=Citrus unshiu TaxID=55188 RepID=A0A2H5QXJ0_CITUN|nr:hypothetical protein CUMW_271160 [Citrus unshiu]